MSLTMNSGRMKKVVQTKTFQRGMKKVHPNEKKVIDRVVRKVMSAPEQGDPKKGDLSGAYTVKFNMHGYQFRLMYEYDDQTVTLLRFGPREGFYGR